MEEPKCPIDTSIKDTTTFVNIQDIAYGLKEETNFVPSIPTGEALEDSHDNVDNPKQTTMNTDEDPGGWENLQGQMGCT